VDLVATLAREGTADDLRSFRSWLTADDALAGYVHLVDRPPGPEEMGAAAEAVRIVGDPA